MRIKRFGDFINEKAIPIADILKDETQQGLLFNKWTRNGKSHIAIMLYDFDDHQILGYIEMAKTSRNSDSFQVIRSAAEKNYGPDLYDFALMLADPEGVRPDSVIRPSAQKIWTYYNSSRPDVKKISIEPGDYDHETSYEIDREHDKESDEEILSLINTKYYLESTKDFKALIDKGKEYLIKYEVDMNDIMKKKDEYFRTKYYEIRN
jgi:hypothetical protein